jgi:predicted dehydrogenase
MPKKYCWRETHHSRKSIYYNFAEAQELAALAKQRLKLSVFQNRRWDSDLKTLQQVISDGVLGDIVEAEFHFDRYNLS